MNVSYLPGTMPHLTVHYLKTKILSKFPNDQIIENVSLQVIHWRGEVPEVDKCEREVYKKYKFYLGFENSQCEDYLTGIHSESVVSLRILVFEMDFSET